MSSKIDQVLIDFKDSVEEKDYTLKELTQLLEIAYKKSFKGRSTKTKSDVKKEPSAYNNFIKNEIIKIKAENSDVEPKNLMAIAAKRWQEQKKQLEQTN